MKIFTEENGKKVVYVQAKDLVFIANHFRTPDEIKNLIPMHATSITADPNEYFSFTNPKFVEFMKKEVPYVVDKDEYDNLTDKEINEKRENLQRDFNTSDKNFNLLPKKDKKITSTAYIGLMTLQHLKDDTDNYLINARNNYEKFIK